MTTLLRAFHATVLAQSVIPPPSWTPRPGEVVNISLPKAMGGVGPVDLDKQTDGSLYGSLRDLFTQSRPSFNPYFGQRGAWFIIQMGGHAAQCREVVFIFPIGPNEKWRMVHPGSPRVTPVGDQAYWNGSLGTYDPEFNEAIPTWFGGAVATTHCRNDLYWLPGGTDGKGQMCCPWGQDWKAGLTPYAHVFDAGVEPLDQYSHDPSVRYWRRGTSFPGFNGNSIASLVWPDAERRRLFCITSPSNSNSRRDVRYYDLATDTWVAAGKTDTSLFLGGDGSCGYGQGDVPHRKLVLSVQQSVQEGWQQSTKPPRIQFLDWSASDTGVYPVATMELLPTDVVARPGMGMTYYPKTGYFYGIYHSGQQQTVEMWRLRPPEGIDLRLTAEELSNSDVMASTGWRLDYIHGALTGAALRCGITQGDYITSGGTSVGLRWPYKTLAYVPALDLLTFFFGTTVDEADSSYAPVQLIDPSGIE